MRRSRNCGYLLLGSCAYYTTLPAFYCRSIYQTARMVYNLAYSVEARQSEMLKREQIQRDAKDAYMHNLRAQLRDIEREKHAWRQQTQSEIMKAADRASVLRAQPTVPIGTVGISAQSMLTSWRISQIQVNRAIAR